jgi:hypothetical protein
MVDIDKAVQTIAEGMGGGERKPPSEEELERRTAEAVKTYGPRVSKLSEKDKIADAVSRVAEKARTGMGLGEADLDTTSVEPIIGAGETALSLASGMVTWGAGKVFAAGPRLMGDTEDAERIESIVNNLAYQPHTDTGKVLSQGVGKGIETFLTPVRWYGEKIQESLIDPMKKGEGEVKASNRAIRTAESFKWFAELTGELAMFKAAHSIGGVIKKGHMQYKANRFLFDEAIKTLEHARDVHNRIAENPEHLKKYAGPDGNQRMRMADGTIEVRKPVDLAEAKKNQQAIAAEKQQAIDVLQEAGGDFELAKTNLEGWKGTHEEVIRFYEDAEIALEKYEAAKADQRYSQQVDFLDEQIRETKDRIAYTLEHRGTRGFHNDMIKQYENVALQLDKAQTKLGKHRILKRIKEGMEKGIQVQDLVIERYGDMKAHEMDSELFIREREANMTPAERQAVPFIIEDIAPSELVRLAQEGKIPAEVAQTANEFHSMSDKAKAESTYGKEVQRIRDYYESSHAFLREHHDVVGYQENYANRVWDLKGKQTRKALGSYFTTKDPFLKGRTIEGLVEGLDRGLKLQTTDIAELLRIYDSYKIKTSYNARFAEAVNNIVHPEYGKVLNTYDRIPDAFKGDFVELPYQALKKAVYRGSTTKPKTVTTVDIVRGKLEKTGETLALVETPIIEKANIWAHKDIVPYLKNIFEPKFNNRVVNALEGINAYQKKINLALSAFHHVALAEAAAGWGIGTKGFVNAVKAMKEGKPWALSTPENIRLAKDAMRHTLVIDPLSDHQVHRVQQSLDRIARKIKGENKGAGVAAEAIAKFNKGWDKILWDYYHSTLKLMAYEKGVHMELSRLAKDGKLMDMTSGEITKIKRQVAGFVNDSFGGQLWEQYAHLGNPKVQQLAQLSILSPDWTISTIKQAAAPFRFKGNKVAARLGTKFWIKAALYQVGIIQALNWMSSKHIHGEGRFTWDNPKGRKTYALLPYRGINGEELYLRLGKQFRESWELITKPLDKIGGKLSPILQTVTKQVFGSAPGSGFPAEWKRRPHESAIKLRAKEFVEGQLPFSLRSFLDPERPAPLAGSIPISKGMSAYQAREQLVDALRAGKSGDELAALRRQITENGLDYRTLLSQAEGTVSAIEGYAHRDAAKKMWWKYEKSGLSLGDFLEIEREKSGLPPKEWRKIRKKFKRILKQKRNVNKMRRRYGIDTHLLP